MVNVRETALKLLVKTFREDAYSNYLYESAATNRDWSQTDRAFLKALYFGVLRQMLLLDRLIGAKCRSPYRKVPDIIKMILRLGLYQILFMDRVPHSAAVSESVTLAKRYGHQGTAGLVNAILRRYSEEKDTVKALLGQWDRQDPAQISSFTSHPLWIVERYIGEFGLEKGVGILEANNGLPPKNFRVADWRRFEQLTAETDIGIEKNLFNKLGASIEKAPRELIDKFKYENIAFPQDQSSLIASSLMDGCQGDGLELCCGRGNKTGAIAEYIDNKSFICSIDLSVNKLKVLKQQNQKHLDRIIAICSDALKPLPFRKKFGWIFLDAPCSNLGTTRRHPEIKYRKTPEAVRESAGVQSAALANAARYLAEGGRILYAVCSIEREETTGVVEQFLSSTPGFALADISAQRPDLAEAGLTDGKCLRIFPGSHGMDGFFSAIFERR
ncbi:MAG: hypothetical protein HZA04_02245 [Nitrospinae bacterium]|nr:hypothetical protein [Nitrospinota bacterium]